MARYTTNYEVSILQNLSKLARVGIVEIGILDAETTAMMSLVAEGTFIYGIDPLIPDSKDKNLIGHKDLIEKNMSHYSNFKFFWDYSYNVVKNFTYDFDFIFFDGSHEYVEVHQDFCQWYPKLECGGLLAFHDSAPVKSVQNATFQGWEGPTQLVKELKENSEIHFVGEFDTLSVFQKL